MLKSTYPMKVAGHPRRREQRDFSRLFKDLAKALEDMHDAFMDFCRLYHDERLLTILLVVPIHLAVCEVVVSIGAQF